MPSYIAIDLKSFYASVECVDRVLDPLKTNLVVADTSRSEKTICLAVSPSLKAYHIPGRARLFEVLQRVDEINKERLQKAPGHHFTGSSFDADELAKHPEYKLEFIAATPRMSHYIEHSTKIYEIYLQYVSPEDIHVYSIDEVFMDVTPYLNTYHMTPEELARKMIRQVYEETGITATAGIGTNLYLCKVAMDIVAKHAEPDSYGARIASLDELSYRKLLWSHEPLTDFWRVGRGYEKKLNANGLYTMGDIAKCSLGKSDEFYNEDLLYDLFGVNAELLIDHAWGYEPTTMAHIKAYKPQSNSISSGQVLQRPYTKEEARLIVHEMADLLSLDLVDKNLITDQIVLTIGFDIDNAAYKGELKTDFYGRKIPKHAHGTHNLSRMSSSGKLIIDGALSLYDNIVPDHLNIRRINITANHVVKEGSCKDTSGYEQLNLFTNYEDTSMESKKEEASLEKERKMQEAMLQVKKKYGKNAMLKGMNLQEGATAMERNAQIGGHKA
ncbi:MAG: DNA methylase [Lachnospiraceae bacterium]|nr:DNA methylase [Lachnospiraceae bacterium]